MPCPDRRAWLVALAVFMLAATSAGCGVIGEIGQEPAGDARYQPVRVTPADVAGGRPDRGAHLMREPYGCGACHVIPGVTGATGMVGPPLNGWSRRVYIAGNLPNRPEQLVRWLREPQAIEPGTAMPDLNVTEADARDMAAYLYSLR
ncbi:MAG: cytochrome c family protein [Chloroflexota bacterium]